MPQEIVLSIDPFVPSNVDMSRSNTRRSRSGVRRTGVFAGGLLALYVAGVCVAACLIESFWVSIAWAVLFGLTPVVAYAVCSLSARVSANTDPDNVQQSVSALGAVNRTELTLPILITLFAACAVSIAAFAVIDRGVWCLAVAGIALTLWPCLLGLIVWRIAHLLGAAENLVPDVVAQSSGDDSTAKVPAGYVGPLRRNAVSADRAYNVIVEQEPSGGGRTATATTVFLTASECPVGCSMCDLWQNTLTTATPTGAIARQIRHATEDSSVWNETGTSSGGKWIKLYNSGNFFDPRSVPPSDYKEIATLCEPYSRVIVENHPKIGSQRMERFASLLSGKLEVAVGLETVQPRWLDRIGKKMTRDDFDNFASRLQTAAIDLRVFLIFGVPGCSLAESARWARLSARHAAWAGARHISVIPARRGHGWGGRSTDLQVPTIQSLVDLQGDALRDVGDQCVVTVDVWDADALAVTRSDRESLADVREVNLRQRVVNEPSTFAS